MDDVYQELRNKGFPIELEIESINDPVKLREQVRLRLRTIHLPKHVEQLKARIQELETKLDESSPDAPQLTD